VSGQKINLEEMLLNTKDKLENKVKLLELLAEFKAVHKVKGEKTHKNVKEINPIDAQY
jgi:hypothetical protein